MAISALEAKKLLASMNSSASKNTGGISADEAKQLLSQLNDTDSNAGNGEGISDGDSYNLSQGIPAFIAGIPQGLLDVGANIGNAEAKGVDYLLGTQFSKNTPRVTLPTSFAMQQAIQQYPGTYGAGQFVGGAAPMAIIPEAAMGKLQSASPYIEQLPKYLQGLGSLGGRAVKGAGLGVALSPAYNNGQDLSQGAEQGATLGALGSMIDPALGGAYRSAGNLMKMGGTASKKEVEDAMESAKRLGVKIPLAETIKSPMGKSMQSSFLSSLPFSGMGKEYVNIGEGLQSQLESLLKDMQPKSDLSVSKDLQSALINARKSAENEKGNLYSRVSDIAKGSSEKVSPNNYRDTAQGKLSDITEFMKDNEEFKDIFDPSVYSILQKASGKGDLSYKAAFDLDKRINGALQKSDSSGDYPTSSILRSLKGAINNDIDQSAENSGNIELTNAWKEAKKHFQENVIPLREGSISKFTDKNSDLDTLIPSFIKTGAYERPQLLNKLTEHLTDDQKSNLAHQYLTKSMKDIGGEDQLESDKVITAYNKLGKKQKDLLFRSQERSKLDDISKIRDMMGMDLKQMISPKTGEKAAKVTAILAPVAAGVAGGLPGAIAAASAGNLSKRAIMSDALKNAYLKALQMSQEQNPNIGRAAYLGLPLSMNNGNK